MEGGYLLHPNQLQPEILAAVMPGVGADYRHLMQNLPRIGSAIAWIDDEFGGEISLGRDGRAVCDYKMRGVDLLKMRDAMKKQALLLFEAGAQYCFLPDAMGTRLNSRADISRLDTIDIESGAILHGAPHPSGALRMGDDPGAAWSPPATKRMAYRICLSPIPVCSPAGRALTRLRRSWRLRAWRRKM